MVETYYPLSTAPAPYDIVWCRFPYVEDPGIAGPEPHPGIVRTALTDNDGNPWVRVVYGTSKDPMRTGLQYFTVANVSEMDACGLYRATRFCFERTLELPWSPEYFTRLPGAKGIGPIIGRLTDYGIHLLQVQMAYYQRGD